MRNLILNSHIGKNVHVTFVISELHAKHREAADLLDADISKQLNKLRIYNYKIGLLYTKPFSKSELWCKLLLLVLFQ